MSLMLENKSNKSLVSMLMELCSMTSNIHSERELTIHYMQIDNVKKELLNRIGE